MSLAVTINAMVAAGCSAEQVGAVVKAQEERRLALEALSWPVQVKATYARDGYVCRYCSGTEGPFEVDHVVPRSKGGTNELSNLVVSCRACNRSKKDRDEGEWRSTSALRQARYRARKRNDGVTERNDGVTERNEVTLSVTLHNEAATARDTPALDKEKSPTPPKEIKPSPDDSLIVCASANLKPDFEEFYSAYPKRINRKGALARYEAHRRAGVPHERIMSGERRWITKWVADRTELQFIPAPDVWLNKAKYDDEVLPDARAGPRQMNGHKPPQTNLAIHALRELMEDGRDSSFDSQVDERAS